MSRLGSPVRSTTLKSGLQVRHDSPLTTHQGEGPSPPGETGRCGLPDPLPVLVRCMQGRI